MSPKMDYSPEKRIAAGDLKNIGSILRDLSDEFKGVVRIRMLREQKTYESNLVLQNGFIIGASIACSEDGAQLFGEKAFIGLVDLIKESSGGFETYEFADPEFKSYVAANESMLLELVRGLGRTLEEIGHVDEDLRKDGLVDLESQWKELEAKWKQFEEREKPYLEMILKSDIRDSSIETCEDVVSSDNPQNAPGPSSDMQAYKERDIPETAPAESGERSESVSENTDPEKGSYGPRGETQITSPPDEKNLDDMILREEPWERASGGASESGSQNEEKEEPRSNAPESSEAAQLRQELSGAFHGADTKEQKAESASSEKTLSDDFNERVRDAILGRSHHRLSENAVSAPKRDLSQPSEQPAKEAPASPSSQPNAHDEWLSRANATLMRLKKKTEEKAPVPSPSDIPNPSGDDAIKPAEPVPLETEPSQDTPNSDESEMGSPSALDEESIIDKIKEASGEEWGDKTSSEISDLKKDVDVYWGWDKRKKRFVGIDGAEMPGAPEKKPDELTDSIAPVNKLKVPLAQCSVLREELKKQAADAREIVIKKEEVAQALLAAQTPPEPPQSDVPQLKKKIGFMDKLKYAKYPQIIKVMEKVDGKKSIDELARETKLTSASVKYIVEKLSTDGYLSAKTGP
jgi:hypothetical protein